jgi:hypothetical protein
MATVLQFVARSLRLLRVIDPNEPVQPDDFEGALVALNAMMARFEADGLAMGWMPIAAASDELPVPPECEEWLCAGLALRVAPEYGKAPDAITVKMYESGLAKTQRDVLTAAPLQLRSSLPVKCARWNIYTDQEC